MMGVPLGNAISEMGLPPRPITGCEKGSTMFCVVLPVGYERSYVNERTAGLLSPDK